MSPNIVVGRLVGVMKWDWRYIGESKGRQIKKREKIAKSIWWAGKEDSGRTKLAKQDGNVGRATFGIWMPFISFPWLTALGPTTSTMVNTVDKNGHLCLVLDFRGKTFDITPSSILAVGFF